MNYRIGIRIVDTQHDGLFDAFARLKRSHSGEAVSDALSLLDDLIRQHFHTEEIVMRDLGLPEAMYQAHVEAHQRILEELADLHWRSMFGDAWTIDEVVSLVAGWVVDHLAEFDLALRPFVHQAEDATPTDQAPG